MVNGYQELIAKPLFCLFSTSIGIEIGIGIGIGIVCMLR
jgi:hypothetical protein